MARRLLRRGFWAEHDAELGATVRGEVQLIYTPVGFWLKMHRPKENGEVIEPIAPRQDPKALVDLLDEGIIGLDRVGTVRLVLTPPKGRRR